MIPPSIAVVAFLDTLALTATVFITSTTALTGFEAVLTKPGDSVTLYCEPEVAGGLALIWIRHGAEVKNDTKYFLDPNNTTLTVRNVGARDVGEYVCRNQQNEEAKVELKSKPVVPPLDKPADLKAGGTLNLTCRAWGWPVPRCTWIRKDKVLSSADPGVSFSSVLTEANTSTENGQLIIVNVNRSDQTDYTCSATNAVATTNLTAYVRVKDPLAAVWPSIGIVIVLVLTVVIIVVVERKRRRDEAKMHPQ